MMHIETKIIEAEDRFIANYGGSPNRLVLHDVDWLMILSGIRPGIIIDMVNPEYRGMKVIRSCDQKPGTVNVYRAE